MIKTKGSSSVFSVFPTRSKINNKDESQACLFAFFRLAQAEKKYKQSACDLSSLIIFELGMNNSYTIPGITGFSLVYCGRNV